MSYASSGGLRRPVVGVSVGSQVSSDHQLARLLQIGVVLEEVVESRAHNHYESLSDDERTLDPEIEQLLADAAAESARHRERLSAVIDELDAETIPFAEIDGLVEAKYGQTKPEDFDGVLYDQLCNEETAYKFYDDLIEAIEASDAEFGIDRDRLLSMLREIRADEADGVEQVTRIMETRE